MTGLCAASVVLLATIEPLRIEVMRQTVLRDRDSSPAVSVVDVSSNVAPGALAALLHLRPYERVSAINDRPFDDDLAALEVIATLAPHTGEYLDLTVSSDSDERRVLVLMH